MGVCMPGVAPSVALGLLGLVGGTAKAGLGLLDKKGEEAKRQKEIERVSFGKLDDNPFSEGLVNTPDQNLSLTNQLGRGIQFRPGGRQIRPYSPNNIAPYRRGY